MKFVQHYLVSKTNELVRLPCHICHLSHCLNVLESAIVAPRCSSVPRVACMQCLLDQDVVVESNDDSRAKIILDTPPKLLMNGMGLRGTNPEVVMGIATRRKVDQPRKRETKCVAPGRSVHHLLQRIISQSHSVRVERRSPDASHKSAVWIHVQYIRDPLYGAGSRGEVAP